MDFSNINNSPVILLAWVTAFGMIISLVEASLKIRFENYNNLKKRQRMIRSLYP